MRTFLGWPPQTPPPPTFVVNGSPTQTAMADSAGACSQVAQLVFAGIVMLVLLYLTGPLQYLPRCVLAGIVFTIAVRMIDVQGLRDIRRESPGEFYLATGAAAAVVAIGVEQGILLAIALSLLRHVRHSYRPHAKMLVPSATEQWVESAPTPGKQTEPGLIIYRFAQICFTRTPIASPTKFRPSSNTRQPRFVGSSSMQARSRISTIPRRSHFAICSMIWAAKGSARSLRASIHICGPTSNGTASRRRSGRRVFSRHMKPSLRSRAVHS
jgi:hypothetical protein